MNRRRRLRGYVTTAPVAGAVVPQSVQNAVLRDHCRRHDADYVLSATEFSLPASDVAWQMVLEDLRTGRVDGVVLYTMFALPPDDPERRPSLATLVASGVELHLAAEGLVIRSLDDLDLMRWTCRVRAVVEGQQLTLGSLLAPPDLQRGQSSKTGVGEWHLDAAVAVGGVGGADDLEDEASELGVHEGATSLGEIVGERTNLLHETQGVQSAHLGTGS